MLGFSKNLRDMLKEIQSTPYDYGGARSEEH